MIFTWKLWSLRTKGDEQFFEAWEGLNGLLLKCSHDGFEKWHQCQYFLEGLLPYIQE